MLGTDLWPLGHEDRNYWKYLPKYTNKAELPKWQISILSKVLITTTKYVNKRIIRLKVDIFRS